MSRAPQGPGHAFRVKYAKNNFGTDLCEEVGRIADESATRGVAHGYVEAWTNGDHDRARDLIDPRATVEWNLALPADVPTLLSTLARLAASVTVRLAEETYADYRAALVYDCATPDGTVRTVEFLAVADGRIQEIRQVYDVTALRRLLPGVLD